MTSITDPPQGSFRPSMLINDTRYRSYTFQAIAFIVLAASIGYLLDNLFENLAAQGLEISFGFLAAPAGYDINQTLIEYTSQSSNLRAAVVGILNTLLVAVLACVTATVFGVLAGVLRLSNNWLVAKLMAIYVEIFRNIPVLIWILIIYGIMTIVLAAPRDFRGDDPAASMFLGLAAFTNRGVYIPLPQFTRGFGAAELGAIWDWLLVIALLIGSLIATRFVTARATRIQEATGIRPKTLMTNLAIWFAPLILTFLILGLTFEIPALRGFNFAGGIKIGAPLIAIWFALSIYTGAFIAENVRAGIQAVSKGQTEAAAALGIRPGRIMSLVILPQALRVIIPPLISNYLNITKNSSLAILVGYADVTATLGGITLNQTGRAIECVLLLMLFYLLISLLISAVINVYNNAIKLKER
ncbi:amino acid ABC transporter permease [Yoonia sediminilitoris]|uniref:L-glutamine ABC transporter membrane protein /L-glutamate ABC transporter membrane protein /L-aspartate ABC transporter membrane protein /L-asparagine ABC transporter membrane protein n=1 Tax=Yoonia sediminilitoris TaxID=1286148 RepID=A0A2T6KPH5_9RHOB|nr:ABC transporter permease subunit [Yoonia sediminilitoris]PUB18425.1 L-glutamine ABC transporter membrane protein /L-glutamate ABC transporter membrane protein /L-aspartate ABC transporter membrane protein /L-asparagine ABC transporter membrane protein [Yoonia sediminilitoris]RCW98593.1 L-glutamine ABC transporter membrane protein /L-glutamate ABC transporter membrane protein /L-aspartate ABC transporter membrane protein /L-asparagine ABC transporter membrane protein [Yoonia sediminilitoris]